MNENGNLKTEKTEAERLAAANAAILQSQMLAAYLRSGAPMPTR